MQGFYNHCQVIKVYVSCSRYNFIFVMLLGIYLSFLSTHANANYVQIALQSENEIDARLKIFGHVERLVRSRDFAGLNALADKYRSSRSRTPSGTWNLTYFYIGLSNQLFGAYSYEGKCVNLMADFARAWRMYDPLHPSSYLVEAKSYMENGWCIRGGGYASEVAAEKMQLFFEEISVAVSILEKNIGLASSDPEFYSTLINAYKSLGKDEAVFEEVLLAGIQEEPYYYKTYFDAAEYLMPRWRGTREAVREFADMAVNMTKKEDGYGVYARIYWVLNNFQDFDESMLDWEKVKLGMRDIVKQHPDRWNVSTFAIFSCQRSDLELAASYINLLGRGAVPSRGIDFQEWYDCLSQTERYRKVQ